MNNETTALSTEIRRLFLSLCVVFCLLILFSSFVSNTVVNSHSQRVFESYIDDYPLMLLPPFLTDEGHENLVERLEGFHATLFDDNSSSHLVLTTEELNYLICKVSVLRNFLRVTEIKDNELGVLLSIPFEQKNKLRYLNGAATIQVSFNVGYLQAFVTSFHVSGKRVPESYIAGIKEQNLTSGLYREGALPVNERDKVREILWRIRKIVLEDGQIEVYGV